MNRGHDYLASCNLVDNVVIKFLGTLSEGRETLWEAARTLILLGALIVSDSSSAFLLVPRGDKGPESTSIF